MSRSVVYKERDTEREWDEQPRRTTYTTVKRYQVPESIARSNNFAEEETKDKIIIRRERRSSPPREEVDYKITERVTREREPKPREEEDFRFKERIIEREREPRRDISYRVVERERDSDNRSSAGNRSDYRSDFRFVERDRETVRAPSPPREQVREYRFERERDFSPPRRERERRDDTYEVDRYVRETDYYAPPAPQPIVIRESAPQPIIIRERDPAPIIIREERREPQYEFIERREVDESRSLVKTRQSSPSPPPPSPQPSQHTQLTHRTQQTQQTQVSRHTEQPPPPPEEDYFYERRVREVDRSRRRDDYDDRRSEIHPKDSASQYSSDDSYEYIRKERTYDEDDKSAHHRRHLAEGALAGAAAGELIRHHRKSQGKDPGGRLKSDLGGAALGAVAAEGISRYRSRSRRRKSRSRSASSGSSYGTKRTGRNRRKKRSRSRSRSRSKSLSSRQKLAAAAGVAAVGALAGYALKNRGKNQETIIVNDPPARRSRSRRRRASADSYMMDDAREMREDDKHRDPGHRNRRIAQAGLASAAAAGIWERVRSKSRGGRERSKSRVKTGVPIAAAGLGGAALAGLWEKNKASKEAKRDAIIEDEMNRGRRPRSRSRGGSRDRSRSRSVPASNYNDERRGVDRHMIAYGDEPISPYEDRGRGGRGYYSDEEPGTYRRRHGGSSTSQSPDNRRRSRSRGRNVAEMGAAAGLAGVAGHEFGKRNERRRQREEAMNTNNNSNNNDTYGPGPSPYDQPSGYLPPQQNPAGYGGAQDQTYPSSNYFPPPPASTGEAAYASNQHDPYAEQQQQQAYPPYNPADYAQQGAQQQSYEPYAPQQNPYDHSRGAYGDSEANLGAPYHGGETYAGDPRGYPQQPETPREERGGRRGGDRSPENVSATNIPPPANNMRGHSVAGSVAGGSVADDEWSSETKNENERDDADGMSTPKPTGSTTPRARSTSRVRFDLGANEAHSPEVARRKKSRSRDRDRPRDREQQGSDSEGAERQHKHHHHGSGRRKKHRRHDHEEDGEELMHDQYDRPPSSATRGRRGDEDDSDGTVEMPRRFDDNGNSKEGGGGLEDLLGGLASKFLGGGDEGEEGRSGRRRHRH